MTKTRFKYGVRSLFLVSSVTFQYIVIQVVWKNTTLLHHSLALYLDRDRHFSANHRSFQWAHVPIECLSPAPSSGPHGTLVQKKYER